MRARAFLAWAILAGSLLRGAGAAQVYVQTNLVSDLPGLAAYTDPNLLNPWGVAAGPNTSFWVADNRSGRVTMYDGAGVPQSLVLRVVPFSGSNFGRPTGAVYNGTNDFQRPTDVIGMTAPARFIFATSNGTISTYDGPPDPVVRIARDNSGTGANYTGLALANNGSENFLYATDFRNGRIDVFSSTFAPVTLAGSFIDPNLTLGYAPFGIENIGGVLFVSYASTIGVSPPVDPRTGFINKFDANGNFLGRFVSDGPLRSPWGMALAPAGFGPLGGSLLVGNFDDGHINAFDPASGAFRGALADASGHPIAIPGLWSLRFGNGAGNGYPNTLYFAAGIAGPDSLQEHGLFGSITAIPTQRQLVNISTRTLVGTGDQVAIGGFILTPNPSEPVRQTKRLLLRGLGPSLVVERTAGRGTIAGYGS